MDKDDEDDFSIVIVISLVAIVIFGVWFRLTGIGWGIADGQYFHPDERNYIVTNALNLFHGESVTFLNYPHFLIRLIGATLHFVPSLTPDNEVLVAHYVGRGWSVFFSSVSILTSFFIAKQFCFNTKVALLAPILLAILPISVWHSHYATTDTISVLFILLTILMTCTYANTSKTIWLIGAGISAGLAAASKYTAGLVVLPIILIIVVQIFMEKRIAYLGKLVIVGFFAIAGMMIASPQSVLDYKGTIDALIYESEHVKTGHLGFNLIPGSVRYSPVIFPLVSLFIFAMGPLLYVSALLSVVWVPFKRVWFLYAFVAAWLALKVFNLYQPARYYLVVVALLPVFIAIAYSQIMLKPSKFIRIGATSWLVITILTTFLYTWSTNQRYVTDTRVVAEKWLLGQTSLKDIVAYWGPKWSMPYSEHLKENVGRMVYLSALESALDIPSKEQNVLVTSSLNSARHLRNNHPLQREYLMLEGNRHEEWRLMKTIRNDYFLKELMEAIDPLFGNYYVSPDIFIYRRDRLVSQLPLKLDATIQTQLTRFSAIDGPWHGSESWGAWGYRGKGSFFVQLSEEQMEQPVEAIFDLFAYNPVEGEQIITVTVNDKKITKWAIPDYHLTESKPTTRSVIISPDVFNQNGWLYITLTSTNPMKPNTVEGNGDARVLGVGIVSLELKRFSQGLNKKALANL